MSEVLEGKTEKEQRTLERVELVVSDVDRTGTELVLAGRSGREDCEDSIPSAEPQRRRRRGEETRRTRRQAELLAQPDPRANRPVRPLAKESVPRVKALVLEDLERGDTAETSSEDGLRDLSDGEVALAREGTAVHRPGEERVEVRLGELGLGDGRVEERAVRDLVEEDVVGRDLAETLRREAKVSAS